MAARSTRCVVAELQKSRFPAIVLVSCLIAARQVNNPILGSFKHLWQLCREDIQVSLQTQK